MKTTLDLPDELMRAIKVRAAQQGPQDERCRDRTAQIRSVPDAQRGSNPNAAARAASLVHCGGAATREQEMTPERVAAALLDQEAQWWSGHDDAAL